MPIARIYCKLFAIALTNKTEESDKLDSYLESMNGISNIVDGSGHTIGLD